VRVRRATACDAKKQGKALQGLQHQTHAPERPGASRAHDRLRCRLMTRRAGTGNRRLVEPAKRLAFLPQTGRRTLWFATSYAPHGARLGLRKARSRARLARA